MKVRKLKSVAKIGSISSTLLLMGVLLTGLVSARSSDVAFSANQPIVIPFLTGPNAGDPLSIALEYIQKNKGTLGLSDGDMADLIVTRQYRSQHNGVTHIYLRQRFAGIEVFNGNININIARDGSVINLGNGFVSNLSEAINRTTPVLSAAAAVESAAQHLGFTLSAPLTIQEVEGGAANEVLLSNGGISQQAIPAKLVYQPLESGEARLAWDVEIYELTSVHYWSMRIDAETGAVLSQMDFVQNDQWAKPVAAVQKTGAAVASATVNLTTNSNILSPDQYEVYAIPSEYPDDGPRVIAVDPANVTASPFGWHDTNGASGAEFTITRGNNVHAYRDKNNNDLPDPGSEPNGGASLDFTGAVVPLNLAQQPARYGRAAIANLFYWNNVIHDVFYLYGFDEPSGNFQVNNYGNGGLGNDDVRAEAQDGGGTNNANMLTLPDGQRPRMQMYIWTSTNPRRDGDLENSIIIHEYGHGISLRLTGTSCLTNAEQMGEGWSDWFALVLTAKSTDTGPTLRGIGTYVLGQPTSGVGIRPTQYTTDFGVNGTTYANLPGQVIPHGVGYVWATILWETYWELVGTHGFNPDIYGDWSTGGNNLALQLVTDGLTMQPCSPGFVDGRDTILSADVALTGGANQCDIWQAFARRGLGLSASQGSPSSISDGTPAFDVPTGC